MADSLPTSDRSSWLLGFATANFVVLVAAAWFVGTRLSAVEDRTARTRDQAERAPGPRPKGAAEKPVPDDEKDLRTLVKEVKEQNAKISSDVYDYYSEIMGDLHEMKRSLRQLSAALQGVRQGLVRPGGAVGTWGLADEKNAPSPETLERYRKEAEAAGIKIAPGRIEVRGFLNMSPKESMPIEYFVTRWPEAGHETLVHVVGPVNLDADLSPEKLKGLVTAVYKGLIVAGFMQGQGSGWDGDPNDPEKKPTWVPPKGDKVYLGVRYTLHGATHLARATDWVIDPAARAVLPEDSFRFTGSRRIEDFDTGDEQLSAEASGLVVSVYRNPNTLIEIAVPSNLNDNYQYNHQRIPKPAILVMGKGGVRLDGLRDRAKGTFTVLGRIAGGATTPLEAPPVLLVNPGEAEAREVPFSKDPAIPGAFVVKDDALASGASWRVRAKIDGETLESQGYEPLYLDLVLSKTPIVPEGDGAKPMEPVEMPKEEEPPAPAPAEGMGK